MIEALLLLLSFLMLIKRVDLLVTSALHSSCRMSLHMDWAKHTHAMLDFQTFSLAEIVTRWYGNQRWF